MTGKIDIDRALAQSCSDQNKLSNRRWAFVGVACLTAFLFVPLGQTIPADCVDFLGSCIPTNKIGPVLILVISASNVTYVVSHFAATEVKAHLIRRAKKTPPNWPDDIRYYDFLVAGEHSNYDRLAQLLRSLATTGDTQIKIYRKAKSVVDTLYILLPIVTLIYLLCLSYPPVQSPPGKIIVWVFLAVIAIISSAASILLWHRLVYRYLKETDGISAGK